MSRIQTIGQTNLRPELAGHLRRRLQAFSEGFRHNLALLGPAGSGKTFQLQDLLISPIPNVSLIYCPLYRESPRSFLTRLVCSVLQAGLPNQELLAGSSIQESFDRQQTQTPSVLLERAQMLLPRTVAAVQPIEGLLMRRLYAEAFLQTLDLIPLLIEEQGKPCVFILDEFLHLEHLEFVHPFHELGKRVMTWPSTLFILASSSLHRARTILRERFQLLFGQFELLVLNGLDPTTAASLAQEQLQETPEMSGIAPFLIQWLGAYPWYLTVFLKRLSELAALAKQPLSPELLFLQTAWDVLGGDRGSLHQWCSARIDGLSLTRPGARALEALIQIVGGARTTTEIGKRIGRGGLPAALQLLVEHDLAQRNGTCWVVPDPLLRCWLSTILSAQRTDIQLSRSDIRHRFETYLRQLWTRWAHSHQLSFSEQVIALFGQFGDETVSLDSKTGRLPRFHHVEIAHPLVDPTPDFSLLLDTAPSSGTDAGPATPQVYLIADGQGKRWCVAVQEGPVDENGITRFDAFCRNQSPKPSRKVVVARSGLDQNARVLAKTVNMWVWESEDLDVLMGLYGQV